MECKVKQDQKVKLRPTVHNDKVMRRRAIRRGCQGTSDRVKEGARSIVEVIGKVFECIGERTA